MPDPDQQTVLEDLARRSHIPAARSKAPGAPAAADSATAPAPRDGSATSNAATAYAAAASKATQATRSGTDGRSSPTTPTPTPASDDNNHSEPARNPGNRNPRKGKPETKTDPRKPDAVPNQPSTTPPTVYPGEVTNARMPMATDRVYIGGNQYYHGFPRWTRSGLALVERRRRHLQRTRALPAIRPIRKRGARKRRCSFGAKHPGRGQPKERD